MGVSAVTFGGMPATLGADMNQDLPPEQLDHYPTMTDVQFSDPGLLLRWYLYLRPAGCQNEEYIFEAIVDRLITEDPNFVVRQHPDDTPIV